MRWALSALALVLLSGWNPAMQQGGGTPAAGGGGGGAPSVTHAEGNFAADGTVGVAVNLSGDVADGDEILLLTVSDSTGTTITVDCTTCPGEGWTTLEDDQVTGSVTVEIAHRQWSTGDATSYTATATNSGDLNMILVVVDDFSTMTDTLTGAGSTSPYACQDLAYSADDLVVCSILLDNIQDDAPVTTYPVGGTHATYAGGGASGGGDPSNHALVAVDYEVQTGACSTTCGIGNFTTPEDETGYIWGGVISPP